MLYHDLRQHLDWSWDDWQGLGELLVWLTYDYYMFLAIWNSNNSFVSNLLAKILSARMVNKKLYKPSPGDCQHQQFQQLFKLK